VETDNFNGLLDRTLTEAKFQAGVTLQHPGWVLIVVGVLIAVIGLTWLITPSIPWLGKLPGDIVIERENFRFYFPLATCVLLSLLLTGIMWIVRHLSR